MTSKPKSQCVFSFFASLLIFSVVFMLASATVLSQVTTAPQSEVDIVAEKYWDNMDDHNDPLALDQFIEKFPTSKLVQLAFLLRYSAVAENPSIDAYNEFLDQYPNQLQSMQALQEVFELYKFENRVSGYVDFIGRYPSSQQSVVAKMRLHALMFEFVTLVDREEEYDAFIETFPDAPQISLVVDIALKKSIDTETQRLKRVMADDLPFVTIVDGQELEYTGRRHRKRDDLATRLSNNWGTWITQYNRDNTGDKSDLLTLYQIQRRAEVLIKVYGDTGAASKVREEARHAELMKKLDELKAVLIENNNRLIESIRVESKNLQKEMRRGFEQLLESNAETQAILTKGFNSIERGMNQLHDKLGEIHQEIVGLRKDIREDLSNIRLAIDTTNQKLDQLDKGLQEIYSGIRTLNNTVAVGFDGIGRKMDELKDEVRIGFDNVNQLQLEQIKVSNRILDATHELTDVTKDGFGNLAAITENGFRNLSNIAIEQLSETRMTRLDLKNGFQGVQASLGRIEDGQNRQLYVSEQILGMTYGIAENQVKTIRAVESGFMQVNQGINTLDRNMQAGISSINRNLHDGFNSVNKNIWQTSNLMRQDIRQMSGRIESQIKSSNANRSSGGGGSKSKSLFGKLLGGAAGVASSFIPGVGPFVAPIVAGAVDSMVQGQKGSTIIKNAVSVASDQYIPGTGNIVSSALNKDGAGIANAALNYANSNIAMPQSRQLINAASTNIGAQVVLKDQFKKPFEGLPTSVPKAVDTLLSLDQLQRKNAVIAAASKIAGNKLDSRFINAISAANNDAQLQMITNQIEKSLGINPNVIMFSVDYIQ